MIVSETLRPGVVEALGWSSLQKKPWLPPVSPLAFWAMSRTTSALAIVAIAK